MNNTQKIINLPDEILTYIFDLIYNNIINCKANNLYYSFYKNLNMTCKFCLNKNKKYINSCNIISFENNEYCSNHTRFEYNICRYLNDIRTKSDNYNLISLDLKKELYSYHIQEEDFDKKEKFSDIFKKITLGTEFIFSHCCCNNKGIMFNKL